MWILKRNGSIQDGPSQSIVALTLLITLASAFFTGVIGSSCPFQFPIFHPSLTLLYAGVHPIFGAFLAGVFYLADS